MHPFVDLILFQQQTLGQVYVGHQHTFVESPLRGLNNISNLCTWQKHPQDPADPDAGDWVDVTSNLSTTNGKLTHTITKLDVATFNSKFRVKVGGSTLNGTNYGTYVTSQNVIFEDLDERI